MIKTLYVKTWIIPIVIVIFAIVFQATGLDIELRYAREDIEQGSWWLLLTGNFVHLGWGHVILNLAGLLMVWWFFIDEFKQYEWFTIILISGLFVTCGLYIFNPNLIWYVGLSGLLHGLFIAGGLRLMATEFKFSLLLLVAIVGKLAYEQIMGSLPGTSEMSGGPVVVNSHLFGAIGGAASYLLLSLMNKMLGNQAAKLPIRSDQ